MMDPFEVDASALREHHRAALRRAQLSAWIVGTVIVLSGATWIFAVWVQP